MIYAMSDIHGCLDALKEKMEQVDLSPDNRMIFLGDYIDYGPDSGGVLRYLYDLWQKEGNDKVVMLKGNHEAMLLEWIDEFKNPVTP
ncbi:MAG: serine/threonine protein phosphatase [Lachnospiraceae bacterium]|nr:serine/threonine protein phosphatase [Lachnospiraceae bacterium]